MREGCARSDVVEGGPYCAVVMFAFDHERIDAEIVEIPMVGTSRSPCVTWPRRTPRALDDIDHVTWVYRTVAISTRPSRTIDPLPDGTRRPSSLVLIDLDDSNGSTHPTGVDRRPPIPKRGGCSLRRRPCLAGGGRAPFGDNEVRRALAGDDRAPPCPSRAPAGEPVPGVRLRRRWLARAQGLCGNHLLPGTGSAKDLCSEARRATFRRQSASAKRCAQPHREAPRTPRPRRRRTPPRLTRPSLSPSGARPYRGRSCRA